MDKSKRQGCLHYIIRRWVQSLFTVPILNIVLQYRLVLKSWETNIAPEIIRFFVASYVSFCGCFKVTLCTTQKYVNLRGVHTGFVWCFTIIIRFISSSISTILLSFSTLKMFSRISSSFLLSLLTLSISWYPYQLLDRITKC